MAVALFICMNLQCFHRKAGLDFNTELLMAWAIGLFSLTLWMAFTPYLALEQARQLAFCLTGMVIGYSLSRVERIRHKVALVRDLHWHWEGLRG